MDTIYALSSGALPAGLGVVRISGPLTAAIVEKLTGSVGTPRAARLASIRSSEGDTIDTGIVLWFPGPHSFTGDDCAEFHLHGSRAVFSRLAVELMRFESCRQAERGEFTLRALHNGKIDLVEAEGLADLLAAETESQRRLAVANANGELSAIYHSWRSALVRIRAEVEALLDFSDEGDVQGHAQEKRFRDEIDRLRAEMEGHVAGYKRSEVIRFGYRVVLAGPPNAGKSSLLNVLAGRDAAIVSGEPGTTRDVIEVTLDLDGVKVIVADTAGLREHAEGIEAIGMAKTRREIAAADLVIWLDDGRGVAHPEGEDAVVVRSKIDLGGNADHLIAFSAVSGEGIGDIVDLIGSRAKDAAGDGGSALPSRLRYIQELNGVVTALSVAASSQELELVSEELRRASRFVDRLLGRIDVEDLLDVIFSQFCIGK